MYIETGGLVNTTVIRLDQMMKKYQAWKTEDGEVFASMDTHSVEELKEVYKATEFLFEFEAATGEEAAAIYNLRMGYGAHEPRGEPENCPNCGSWFYPQGSGECWKCGEIC